VSPRLATLLDMRRIVARSDWVSPGAAESGHIEKYTLKRQHAKAPARICRRTQRLCNDARYVHPQVPTIVAAMERARAAQSGHKTGHKNENADGSANSASAAIQ
jgi:hypothetical protein